MNPTDQARTFYKTYNYGFAFAVFTEGRNADVSDVGKMRGYLLVPGPNRNHDPKTNPTS